MKFVRENGSFIRKKVTVERMMFDVVLALSPLFVFSIIMYHVHSFLVVFLSILFCVLFEYFGVFLLKNKLSLKEIFKKKNFLIIKDYFSVNNLLSSTITGFLIGLLLPPFCSIYVVFLACICAIFICKIPFGGMGYNIFNPAACGFVFVKLCFPDRLNEATKRQIEFLRVHKNSDVTSTVLESFKKNLSGFNDFSKLNTNSLFNSFFGFIPGSIGEVNKLLIIIALVYLLLRKSIDFRIVLSNLLTCLSIFLLIGIYLQVKYSFSAIRYTMLNMLSGGILFGSVFMLTDPITSPVTGISRYIYGIFAGFLMCIIRLFGANPEGVCFSILLSNIIVNFLDYIFEKNDPREHKKTILIVSTTFILFVLFVFVSFILKNSGGLK